MIRTPLLRKTPLKRSMVRMKTSRKTTAARKSAQGQACLIRLPGCFHDAASTVLCHYSLPGYFGIGLKAPDELGAYGCAHCHDIVDGRIARPGGYTRESVRLAFAEGVMRSWMKRKDPSV